MPIKIYRHVTSLFIALLVAGMGFLAFFVFPFRGFYLNDSANKIFLIEKLAGDNPFDFKIDRLFKDEWAEEVWEATDTRPFREPFIVKKDEVYFCTQTPLFCWLTSWFYRFLGWPGLNIIPLLSLALLLLMGYDFAKKTGLSEPNRLFALILVGLCTPLALYGSLLWEHTLGDLIVLIVFLIFLRKPEKVFFAGLLLGIGLLIRLEFISYFPTFLFFVLTDYERTRKDKKDLIAKFLLGGLIGVLLFFSSNSFFYSHPFGLTYSQLAYDNTGEYLLSRKWIAHYMLSQEFWSSTYLLLCLIPIALGFKKNRNKLESLAFRIALVCVVFAGITALISPNAGGKTMGSRYLQSIYIPLTVSILLGLGTLSANYRTTGRIVLVVLALFSFGSGFLRNIVKLPEEMERTSFVMKTSDETGISTVVTTYVFSAYYYALDIHRYNVFYVDSREKMATLKEELCDRNIEEILFYDRDSLLIRELGNDFRLTMLSGENFHVNLYLLEIICSQRPNFSQEDS